MADHHKKPVERGVVDSIADLRHLRYMTKGPGRFEKKRAPATPSIKQLRADVAKVTAPKAKKAKKRRARR